MAKKVKTVKSKKKIANLTICISDAHWGHESCLYETFWDSIDRICNDLKFLKRRYDWNTVKICCVGDMVSGTHVYRNQYLESHLNKNEDILTFAGYMLYKVIKRIEDATGMNVLCYVVTGTHEGLMRAFPHNFGLGLSRRLSAYGKRTRYASKYFVLDLAKGFSKPEYNVLFFHGFGGADYSSASPSLIRELTTTHSQFAVQFNKIIQRFCIGHSHWLEINRAVLGIRFDCLGGYMRWDKKISNRESGMLYYIYTEDGLFDVKGISSQAKQLEESSKQGLHALNMRYVADILLEAYQHELDLGILTEKKYNGIEEKDSDDLE
jgi:hypothetical protein